MTGTGIGTNFATMTRIGPNEAVNLARRRIPPRTLQPDAGFSERRRP
jgi:hypothetical protein